MPVANEVFIRRLHLRLPRKSDAGQIFARYGQDPDASRYMHWTPHGSVEDTLSFLDRIVADNDAGRTCGYLIFNRDRGGLLGSIGGAIDEYRVQFGYCLAKDAWGRGIAREAARAFIEEMFAQLPVLRIQAFCDVQNPASARVLEKAGLTLEGTLRSYLVMPSLAEVPRDILLYAKVRER
jgi:RimJ/RimL family protein N-acetyltransferase